MKTIHFTARIHFLNTEHRFSAIFLAGTRWWVFVTLLVALTLLTLGDRLKTNKGRGKCLVM